MKTPVEPAEAVEDIIILSDSDEDEVALKAPVFVQHVLQDAASLGDADSNISITAISTTKYYTNSSIATTTTTSSTATNNINTISTNTNSSPNKLQLWGSHNLLKDSCGCARDSVWYSARMLCPKL